MDRHLSNKLKEMFKTKVVKGKPKSFEARLERGAARLGWVIIGVPLNVQKV